MSRTHSGSVVTVTEIVSPAELGRTLMHEHVTTMVPKTGSVGTYLSGGKLNDQFDMATRALSVLGEHQIGTVVNLSGGSLDLRDSEKWSVLRRISTETNLQIVAGFAYGTERNWPDSVLSMSLDELVESFVDAASDILGSGTPAGIFGEVGTSLDAVTEGEERCLRAVAIAQRATGRAISTHSSLGTMGSEQIQILAAAGTDLEQVVIGHADLKPDVDYHESMLRTGVTLAFDTFGKEYFDYILTEEDPLEVGGILKRLYLRTDDARVDALVQLVNRGWAKQLVLSTDMSGYEAYLNQDTHGRHGYGYLPERVLPRLLERGVSESEIHTMLVENPARMLTIR